MDLIKAIRELMTPETPDRNAFRLEDWNDWPERWRRAYEFLRREIESQGESDGR